MVIQSLHINPRLEIRDIERQASNFRVQGTQPLSPREQVSRGYMTTLGSLTVFLRHCWHLAIWIWSAPVIKVLLGTQVPRSPCGYQNDSPLSICLQDKVSFYIQSTGCHCDEQLLVLARSALLALYVQDAWDDHIRQD